MMPLDVATRETVDFIARHLPTGGTLLEVGCGAGHVAEALARLGYRVIAVDDNAEVVAKAQARGVATIVATWPDYQGEPVDSIAFTRSLHHIGPLDPAIERARELLEPAGVLLVEDFSRDAPDRKLIDWFVGQLRSPDARTLIRPTEGELVTALLEGDPREAWRARHDRPDLHGATAMERTIRRHFGSVEVSTAPYLYRYLIPVLPETPSAAMFVERVLAEERMLGECGGLIGRRIVASVGLNRR